MCEHCKQQSHTVDPGAPGSSRGQPTCRCNSSSSRCLAACRFHTVCLQLWDPGLRGVRLRGTRAPAHTMLAAGWCDSSQRVEAADACNTKHTRGAHCCWVVLLAAAGWWCWVVLGGVHACTSLTNSRTADLAVPGCVDDAPPPPPPTFSYSASLMMRVGLRSTCTAHFSISCFAVSGVTVTRSS